MRSSVKPLYVVLNRMLDFYKVLNTFDLYLFKGSLWLLCEQIIRVDGKDKSVSREIRRL